MFTDAAIDELIRTMKAARSNVQVVAIDGHSAAGKSTFADRLAERLEAAIVRGDDFYRVMDPEKRAALTAEQGARQFYDWERMLNEVIEPLTNHQRAVYRFIGFPVG